MRFRTCFLNLALILGVAATLLFMGPSRPAQAADFPEIMIILDASGSMWGQAGGQTKIAAAREVLNQLIPELPAEVKVGLTAYGHRRKGDCQDIEILLPTERDDRQGLLAGVAALSPMGKTPIADSIKTVVETLKSKENETTIILVSDGEETCNPDPCGVVKALKASGIKFLLHVVGFDVDRAQQEELACLAAAGGGQYFGAANAAALLAALRSVKSEVVEKVEFEKAKATTTKKRSGLGKLRLRYPPGAEKGLGELQIIRKSDGKLLKKVESPGADSLHPLPAGDYDIVLAYANSNYQAPSAIAPQAVSINGGETTEIKLGSLIFNVADSLNDPPAESVTLTSADGSVVIETPARGNGYYFFVSKPLPPGTYSFSYFYKTMAAPVVAARDLEIREMAESVITLDSGIRLKEHQQPMTGFDLIDQTSGQAVVQVKRRWDNDYPLWAAYIVPPGSYALNVYLKGMSEPLPVADNITIKPGELLEFDTGL